MNVLDFQKKRKPDFPHPLYPFPASPYIYITESYPHQAYPKTHPYFLTHPVISHHHIFSFSVSVLSKICMQDIVPNFINLHKLFINLHNYYSSFKNIKRLSVNVIYIINAVEKIIFISQKNKQDIIKRSLAANAAGIYS